MDLSTGKPITVYPKLLVAALSRTFLPGGFLVILFWAIAHAMQNNVLSSLIIFIGIMGIVFAVWHTKHSKIEYYADALIIYSPFRRNVIFLNDISDLILEFSASRYRRSLLFVDDDFPGIGYTRYWITRHNGSTVHFSDEYQDYEKLVEVLKMIIYKENGPLSHKIAELNTGGKTTFLQITATKEGVKAENGDLRIWSQLRLIDAEFPRKISLIERNKKRTRGKQDIWITLPRRRSLVFEGIIKFFLAPP